MISKHSSFFPGFLVGALASSAVALFLGLQPGGRTRIQTGKRTKALSTHPRKTLDRYVEELGGWSGKGIETKEVSPEAFAKAPLGWY